MFFFIELHGVVKRSPWNNWYWYGGLHWREPMANLHSKEEPAQVENLRSCSKMTLNKRLKHSDASCWYSASKPKTSTRAVGSTHRLKMKVILLLFYVSCRCRLSFYLNNRVDFHLKKLLKSKIFMVDAIEVAHTVWISASARKSIVYDPRWSPAGRSLRSFLENENRFPIICSIPACHWCRWLTVSAWTATRNGFLLYEFLLSSLKNS